MFASVSFLIGSVAYYVKYESQFVESKKYDFSKQDSLFWASKNKSETSLSGKKTVDYEQELLDFSNDNYSERDNDQYSDLKININNATIEELILLPGIGEKTAKNIVSFREQNGRFSIIDDITKVPGIGSKKFKKLRSYIIIE